MKFVIDKEKLLNGLNIVTRATAPKSNTPILSCILVTADENGVKLTGNNLELGIETAYIEAKVTNSGKVALEARIFNEIVRKLPEDTVSFGCDARYVCNIKSGRASFKIAGQHGEEYPALPRIDGDNDDEYILKQRDVREMIKGTAFSVSIDESKPIFTGLLFQIKNNYLAVVSLDGIRVSVRKHRYSDVINDLDVVVPGKNAVELMKLLSDGQDERLNLKVSDRLLIMDAGHCTIVSSILEGEYINYDKLINVPSTATTFRTDRIELLSALERAALLSIEARKSSVEFVVKEGKIEIYSRNQIDAFNDEVEGVVSGEPLSLMFNTRYLIEALKAINDEEIIMNFTAPTNPCIISQIDEGTDFAYLVLPLRVKDDAGAA